MYKLIVLTNPESAPGFKLAGVDVIEVKSGEEARTKLISALNDDRLGIIAIDEDFLVGIDEALQSKIERLYRPIVIPIPSQREVVIREMGREHLVGLIRRAVGFDIRLRQG